MAKILTEEHKLSIASGMKKFFENGGVNGRYGKSNSEYQKSIVSKRHKGVRLTEEHRKKISTSRIGLTFSEEHRKNLRLRPNRKYKKMFNGTSNEYKYIHAWLKKEYAKISCNTCGSKNRLEYASLNGEYGMDINNFIVLCKPCHYKHDSLLRRSQLDGNK
jgi:hypothetical protein